MKVGLLGLVLLISIFIFFSLLLSSFSLFSYLIVLENFNVLMLIVVLLMGGDETRIVFMSMMAIFVLNISIMLIVTGLELCGDTLRSVVGL